MIKVIAFESLKRPGFYVSDGLDVPSCDENGETDVLEDALLVIRTDLTEPQDTDLEAFYEFFSSMKMFDYDEFRKGSKPVHLEINEEQLAEIKERNEWQ